MDEEAGPSALAAPADAPSVVESAFEDDPVVSTTPLYLSQQLARYLYVAQYPQVSRLRRMQAPSAARLRPQSELLEVDYKLDPESVNYDPSVPEDKRIETIRYTSSVGASKNQYAVLVVRDGEAHLTPVRTLFQLRTDFRHLDNEDTRELFGAEADEAERKRKEQEEQAMGKKAEPEGPQRVGMVFKKRESSKAAAARMSSYRYMKTRQAKETWRELTPHNPEEERSRSMLRKLLCRDTGRRIPVDQDAAEYLESIQMPPVAEDGHQDPTPEALRPLASGVLRTMGAEQQVQAILAKGRVLRFAFVANLASSCRTNEEVLSFLEKHGLLVQGCWALRRDPHHSPSHAALRVIILSAFRAHRKLDRLAIEEQVKAVPSLKRLVRPILEELAVLRRWERSWELKQPWEPEFEQANRDVVARQQAAWQMELAEAQHHIQAEHRFSVPLVADTYAAGSGAVDAAREGGLRVSMPPGADVASVSRIPVEQRVPGMNIHIPSKTGGVDVEGVDILDGEEAEAEGRKGAERGADPASEVKGVSEGKGAAASAPTEQKFAQGKQGMEEEEEEAEVEEKGVEAASASAASRAPVPSTVNVLSAGAAPASHAGADHADVLALKGPVGKALRDRASMSLSELVTELRGQGLDAPANAVLEVASGLARVVGKKEGEDGPAALLVSHDALADPAKGEYRSRLAALFDAQEALKRKDVVDEFASSNLSPLKPQQLRALLKEFATTERQMWRLRR